MNVCDECPISHSKGERGIGGKFWYCPLTGQELWKYETGLGIHPLLPTVTKEWFVGPDSCPHAPALKHVVENLEMYLCAKPRPCRWFVDLDTTPNCPKNYCAYWHEASWLECSSYEPDMEWKLR